jgi:ATP adenylyltransferase
MVVPNAHSSDFDGLPDGVYAEVFDLVRRSAALLRAATGAEAMNIGVNLGRPAGAGIHEHVHVHLVPRWTGDNNFMPVLSDTRVLPELLEKTWVRLRPEFSKLDGGAA